MTTTDAQATVEIARVRALLSLLKIPTPGGVLPHGFGAPNAVGDIAVFTTRGKEHYGLVVGHEEERIDVQFITRSGLNQARRNYQGHASRADYPDMEKAKAERQGRDPEAASALAFREHVNATTIRYMPHAAFAPITTLTFPIENVDVAD